MTYFTETQICILGLLLFAGGLVVGVLIRSAANEVPCPHCKEKDRKIELLREGCADYEEALGPHPTIPNGQFLRRIKELREERDRALHR